MKDLFRQERKKHCFSTQPDNNCKRGSPSVVDNYYPYVKQTVKPSDGIDNKLKETKKQKHNETVNMIRSRQDPH